MRAWAHYQQPTGQVVISGVLGAELDREVTVPMPEQDPHHGKEVSWHVLSRYVLTIPKRVLAPLPPSFQVNPQQVGLQTERPVGQYL